MRIINSAQVPFLLHSFTFFDCKILGFKRTIHILIQGKQISGVGENFHDAILENQMLQSENESLRQRVKSLQGTIDVMATRNAQLQTERDLSNLGGSATGNFQSFFFQRNFLCRAICTQRTPKGHK